MDKNKALWVIMDHPRRAALIRTVRRNTFYLLSS